MSHEHDRKHQQEEEREEERLFRALRKIFDVLEEEFGVLKEIRDLLTPRLSTIRQNFALNGATMQGPITLNVGQKTKETVLGFNADGSPFTGTMPPITYSTDNVAVAAGVDDGANGSDITGVAAGTTNASANLTTAEGLVLSAVTVITVAGGGPTQVLASIVQDFTTPTP